MTSDQVQMTSSGVNSMPRLRARWLFAAVCLFSAVALAQEKANDAVVPVPRDANWMKRHDSFNERVKQGNVDLVFIGDSITQGWEGNGKNVWAEYYAKRNAVNLGISGDKTKHGLGRHGHGRIDGIRPQ